MSPQRKAVSHSRLPGLCPHSVLTWPVTERVYLWCVTPFGVSKPSRFLQRAPRPLFLWEEEESPSPDLPLVGPLLRELWPDCAPDRGLGPPRAESPLLGFAAGFPAPTPGSSAHSGTRSPSVTPRVLRPHCPCEGSTPCLAARVMSLTRADFYKFRFWAPRLYRLPAAG